MSSKSNGLRICLVTFPVGEFAGSHVLVLILLRILEPLAERLVTISGNFPEEAIFSPKIKLINVSHDSKRQPIALRIPKYILTQLRISCHLASEARNSDVVVFYVGGTALVLPMLMAKLLHRKVVLVVTGSGEKTTRQMYRSALFGFGDVIVPYIMNSLESVNYILADRIVAYSDCLVDELGLGRYRSKTILNQSTFVDADLFNMETDVQQRANIIGYVGRLSEEKGVRNLVQAIPLVANKHPDARFLIVGDGVLSEELKGELKRNGFYDRTAFTGWIPHERLPEYLNKLRLLVVPSYTETFAAAASEAMACGTPVLATPVGATPDIIRDEQNGFILEDNSPESIAMGISRVLNHPRLPQIAASARVLVENKYGYNTAVEEYRSILDALQLMD